VNPAAFEIAGHMVLKRAVDYEAITQDWAWALLEQVRRVCM
jgi:GDP-L-galactose phosphorylase